MSEPHWLVVGDCVAGTSHLRREAPCQDCWRHALLGDAADRLVIVVADGAGSSSHGGEGALFVCEEIIRRLTAARPAEFEEPESLPSIIADVRIALLAHAREIDLPPRQMACTLCLAIVGPDCGLFAQIGDGAIVVAHSGEPEIVFWPEAGEYAGMTDFLTDEAAMERLAVRKIDGPIPEIAVLTDGLQRLALNMSMRTPHSDFFRPLFVEIRNCPDPSELSAGLREFLESPRVRERSDDDLTLVLAVRRP